MRIWRSYNDTGWSRGAWLPSDRSRTDALPAW